jgi:hypothetical protein
MLTAGVTDVFVPHAIAAAVTVPNAATTALAERPNDKEDKGLLRKVVKICALMG